MLIQVFDSSLIQCTVFARNKLLWNVANFSTVCNKSTLLYRAFPYSTFFLGKVGATEQYQQTTLYTVVTTGKSWDDAKKSCEAMGSKLTSLTAIGEQKRLAEFLKLTYPSKTVAFWVGSKATDAGKDWKWVTGEALNKDTPFLWNDADKTQQAGRCLAFVIGAKPGFAGGQPCTNLFCYICERQK